MEVILTFLLNLNKIGFKCVNNNFKIIKILSRYLLILKG